MASGKLIMTLVGITPATAPCTGEISCASTKSLQNLQQGTADNQYDAVHARQQTVAASGSFTIDLTNAVVEDPIGDQFAPMEIAAMLIRNTSATDGTGGTVEVRQGAANPHSAILKTAGASNDAAIVLPPGCAFMVDGLIDGSYPVTGASKEYDIVETGGANSADLEIVFLGRRS